MSIDDNPFRDDRRKPRRERLGDVMDVFDTFVPLGKMALTALPVASLLAKPNSKFGGVQIGINAPYSMHGLPGGADDILTDMIQLNLSSL